MSSFTQPTVNPITGQIQDAVWMDDYYKDGVYGVRFPGGRVYPEYKVSVPESQQRTPLDYDAVVVDTGEAYKTGNNVGRGCD